jgi:hypothetical protein
MKVMAIGIDLAKNVFSGARGRRAWKGCTSEAAAEESGHGVFRSANSVLVEMEAYGGAHEWRAGCQRSDIQ